MFASFILFHYLRSFLLLERTCTLPNHVTAPAAPTPFHPLPPFLHFTIYCSFPSHRRLLNISTHIAFPLAAPPTHSSRKQNTTLKPDARARVPIAIIWAKQWITDDGKLLARLDAAAKAAEAKPSTQGAKATGERYLPKKARAKLTKAEYAKTTAAKRKGRAEGKQFVKQPKAIAKKTAKVRNAAKGGSISGHNRLY